MTISYELARELRVAAFSQVPTTHGGVGYYITESGRLLTTIDFIGEGMSKEPFAYVPTLSELIEACGEDFIELEKVKDVWWSKGAWEKCGEGECPKYDVMGSTPDEAVAKLWLEINKTA